MRKLSYIEEITIFITRMKSWFNLNKDEPLNESNFITKDNRIFVTSDDKIFTVKE